MSSFAFGQTNRGSSDPLSVYLNEEEDRENNQTAEEKFQDYVSTITLERQAFRQGLSSMLNFLKNIEESRNLLLTDVVHLREKVEEATDLLSENTLALLEKEDVIYESLEKCVTPAPEAAPAQ
ncbi:MAG: hypothetical protein OXB86_02790 [Bdellovibrionales bacterium]|nr:hypothetical protein [Bdellovibrionales bacterium]